MNTSNDIGSVHTVTCSRVTRNCFFSRTCIVQIERSLFRYVIDNREKLYINRESKTMRHYLINRYYVHILTWSIKNHGSNQKGILKPGSSMHRSRYQDQSVWIRQNTSGVIFRSLRSLYLRLNSFIGFLMRKFNRSRQDLWLLVGNPLAPKSQSGSRCMSVGEVTADKV